MCKEIEEDYKPNKYTRHISNEDWRRLQRAEGQVVTVTMINPGYVNEPGQEPRKAGL